jgi:cell division protein FtsW
MIVVMVCVTVALEKHMSATIILFIIGAGMIFISGANVGVVLAIGGIFGAVALPVLLTLKYTRARIDAWLHPELHLQTGGFQPYESLLAIGSGGIFGVGLGNSNQKYGYVSEPQNDFIFSIICEELGFIGAALTILLFACLVFRGFQIAAKAPNRFCALTVYGLSFKVALQAALNIAVVTNMMPNTGISLPFFSSGGTSLALQIFEIGIILSISRFSALKKE